MRSFWRFAFLSAWCLAPMMAYGIENFEKLWGLVTYTNKFHQFLYMIEPQVRLINRSEPYEQFLLNTGGAVELTPMLQLWLGQTITNFSPYNAVAGDSAADDLNEYRLWQQLLWIVPNTGCQNVLLKSRIEERYSFNNAPWAVRLRERAYWTKPITARQSLVLSDEFFVNLKTVPWVVTSTLDQNRAYIGVLHQLTPIMSVSFSYMNQYIFRVPAEDNHGVVINFFINMG